MQNKEIENLVLTTQQRWADIVLEIGEAYRKEINLKNLVYELLHNLYYGRVYT